MNFYEKLADIFEEDVTDETILKDYIQSESHIAIIVKNGRIIVF